MATAILVQKIGPYHHARFKAAAREGDLIAIEYRTDDKVYAWTELKEDGGYARVQALSLAGLTAALDRLQPEAMVCVGYADPEIHCALAWATARGTPLVVCSDSTYEDEVRSGWKEGMKRVLVRAFAAGFVAGSRSRVYLAGLGMKPEAIFQPWDVVDNDYFARGAAAARADAAAERRRLGLPEKYFLCVARFVPKKNLPVLLNAYARYVRSAGPDAWALVLSGSGELDQILRTTAQNEGVAERVKFVGFKQYPDLPACYGLAGALVLPSAYDQWGLVVNEAMAAGLPVIVSDRCGCVTDLVQEGCNGGVFPPDDPGALADILGRVAGSADLRRQAAEVSAKILESFSVEEFSRGLWRAVAHARSAGDRRPPLTTRALIRLLAARGRGAQLKSTEKSGKVQPVSHEPRPVK